MKSLKNNEGGFAFVLTVMLISVSVLTSLAMTYVYTANRLKYHFRIKETYKLINATESAAKTVKSSWDKAFSFCATYPGACGGSAPNAVWTYFSNNQSGLITPGNSVPNGTTPCGTATSVRVDNPDNPSAPYCFEFSSNPVVKINTEFDIQLKLQEKYPEKEFGKYLKFLAKVDRFYEALPKPQTNLAAASKPKFLDWIFGENASADVVVTPVSPATTVASDCATTPTDPGCMRCKDGTGVSAKSVCVTITACPSTWANCLASPTSGVTQSFRVSTDIDDM